MTLPNAARLKKGARIEALMLRDEAHAAAEEETFYASLMTKTWGQDKARHSVAEHK